MKQERTSFEKRAKGRRAKGKGKLLFLLLIGIKNALADHARSLYYALAAVAGEEFFGYEAVAHLAAVGTDERFHGGRAARGAALNVVAQP